MPKTATGRVIGALAGLFGLLFMAMPLAIVGGSFHSRYEKLEQQMAEAKAAAIKKAALLKELNDELTTGNGNGDDDTAGVDVLAAEKLDLETHIKRCADIITDMELHGADVEELQGFRSAISTALNSNFFLDK